MPSPIRLAILATLGLSLSGCIVLPWGGHRHGGLGGYRHLSATPTPPTLAVAPSEPSAPLGR